MVKFKKQKEEGFKKKGFPIWEKVVKKGLGLKFNLAAKVLRGKVLQGGQKKEGV